MSARTDPHALGLLIAPPLLLLLCALRSTESWLVSHSSGVRASPFSIVPNDRQGDDLSSTTFGCCRRSNVAAHALYATPSLRPIAAAGILDSELGTVREAIAFACQDQEVLYQPSDDSFVSISNLNTSNAVPGSTGRVILLQTQNLLNNEDAEDLKNAISMELDEVSHKGNLSQPILVCLRDDDEDIREMRGYLSALIQQEVDMYEMRMPLPSRKGLASESKKFVPSIHFELDGAYVADTAGATFWDTSTCAIFDDLVSDDLRGRLLDVVLGRSLDSQEDRKSWDDVNDGPDPQRWARGGLDDVAGGEPTCADGTSWGLTEDGVAELCFEHHDALQEFEMNLSELFSDFVVSRLPEAVMGSHVTPLTANAPTGGDTFDYHIDADPNLTPPSPWTDVFGRYPNRCLGKPRFMSCIVYLNDHWDSSWGAPTRFVDVATDRHYDVQALPGRCVVMDQDITHTVVAPNEPAGKRPRYSLVWKLIVHPKSPDQDMTRLARSAWPEPLLMGSAAKDPNDIIEAARP